MGVSNREMGNKVNYFLAKKYKNLKSTEWNEDVRRSNLCTKK